MDSPFSLIPEQIKLGGMNKKGNPVIKKENIAQLIDKKTMTVF